MNEYGEKAKAYFHEGYSCAQAVVLTFTEELGIDRETALKVSAPFGGGMGRLREVCGAVSGMFMVLGFIDGCTSPKDREAKTALYKQVQEMAQKFKEENGSIVCRELLGTGQKNESPVPDARTAEYYKKRPCAELVADAAELVADYLKNR